MYNRDLIQRAENLHDYLREIDPDVIDELLVKVSKLEDEIDEIKEEHQEKLNDLQDEYTELRIQFQESIKERLELLAIIDKLRNELDIPR
jgi:Skp family chaperone for outer membrane proteins